MAFDGIISIYKEQNMTSHDVVGHIRRILGERRVGHTGTLDPMATGVLPVCVGRTARVMEYLDTDLKRYRCVMKLGRATNTYDVWGETSAEVPSDDVDKITEDDVRKVMSEFTGRIKQLPPLYSAVKVNGKRLYEYARKGRDVEIPEREVYITSLEVEDMELGRGYDSWIRFSCECTKGTFIRSICNDAGEKLGVHAVLTELERTKSGIFDIGDAVSLDELREIAGCGRKNEREAVLTEASTEKINSLLHAPDDVLGMFGAVRMERKDALRLINGLEIERSVYTVTEEPKFLRDDFYFPVKEEYKRLYRIYAEFPDDMEVPGRPNGTLWFPSKNGSGLRFIGLAVRNDENGHLIPHKIFI